MICHLDSPGCPGLPVPPRSCPRKGHEAPRGVILGASHRPQLSLQAKTHLTRIIYSPVSAASSAKMKRTLGATSGLPGQINLICSEFLTAGMFEEVGIDLVGQPRVGVGARIPGWGVRLGGQVGGGAFGFPLSMTVGARGRPRRGSPCRRHSQCRCCHASPFHGVRPYDLPKSALSSGRLLPARVPRAFGIDSWPSFQRGRSDPNDDGAGVATGQRDGVVGGLLNGTRLWQERCDQLLKISVCHERTSDFVANPCQERRRKSSVDIRLIGPMRSGYQSGRQWRSRDYPADETSHNDGASSSSRLLTSLQFDPGARWP